MARAATDADFNQASRYLEVKLDIYFDGIGQAPITVLKSDYIVDADWLEEGSAESSNPFGNVSSNELTFRLFNKNGMFSPTNAAGPYYGKIKSGVLVIPSIKPVYDDDDVAWTQLGKYYVTGWDAQVTGTYADITANDEWYQIFNNPIPNYPISLNKTFHDFLSEVLDMLGYTVTVDELLTTILPYAFVDGTVKEFLQNVTAAALAYVTSNKSGEPVIGALIANRTTRATLTDADQIKTVSAKQSIIKSYDGVELTYNVPQVSELKKLVELTGLTLKSGANALNNIAVSEGPMWQVNDIAMKANSKSVTLTDYTATPWLISLAINSVIDNAPLDIAVYGKVISLTEVKLADDVTKLLKEASKYIQNSTYAAYYKTILNAFVTNHMPLLSLSVRGNPLLNIGDKVVIQSTKYNLNFTGIIQRMAYKYAGALSCDMVLLNEEVLQGVGA